MKIDVNGNCYEIEIIGNKAKVNGRKIDLRQNEEQITIGQKQYFLDFIEEGDPALLIINGMSYLVSKGFSENTLVRELRAPISGQIVDIFATEGKDIVRGQLLMILEAMKMENQIKAPANGRIKEVKVKKGELVKTDQVLVTFG